MMIIFLDDSYLKSYFFLIKEDHLVIFNCCVFIQEKMPINFESLIKHIKYIRGHPSKCESRIHATWLSNRTRINESTSQRTLVA